MTEPAPYIPVPPNPKTTLRNPWILFPLLIAVMAVVGIRLSFTRDTVGILYKPVETVTFHGVTLPPPAENGKPGIWYETRTWLGSGPDDLKTVWSKGLHYSVFFSLTNEAPDAWLKRVTAERDFFRTGDPLQLIVSNPCIVRLDAVPARPRPKVEGVMANLLVKGGVQIQISGKIDQSGVEGLISRLRCEP